MLDFYGLNVGNLLKISKKIQHTFGTYPTPSIQWFGNPFISKSILGYLEYVPVVCWNFLKNSTVTHTHTHTVPPKFSHLESMGEIHSPMGEMHSPTLMVDLW